MALKQNQISTASIHSILISHFHGDHYGGIPFFLIDAFYEEQRTEPLKIAGPPGVQNRVFSALENLYPGIDPTGFSYKIEFFEYSPPDPVHLDDLVIQAFEVIHAPDSLPHAIKVQVNDKILAFSGDTGWVDSLPEIADQSDLFICESNFYDTVMDMHLSYLRIEEARPELNCRKLILNHLGSEMLENLDKVQIDCASDGQKIQL